MSAQTPKYEKPRIALIDLSEEYPAELRDAGFNVTEGSFGLPYKASASHDWFPLSFDTCGLSDLEEQEVVIVSNAIQPSIGLPPEEPGDGVPFIGQEATHGVIDPRPFFMSGCQAKFDRILRAGGLFIVFGADLYLCEYHKATITPRYGLRESTNYKCTNWNFLSDLGYLNIRSAKGREVDFDSSHGGFVSLIERGFAGGHYSCILRPESSRWISLAKNKYGETVAGMFTPDKQVKGNIIILPESGIDPASLVRLIHEWGPTFSPKFFPFHANDKWIHSPEYEIPRISDLQRQIVDIASDAKRRVDSLKKEIEKTRLENPEWYSLLNGTDRALVLAVIQSLKKLGFNQVIDVDEQHDAAAEGRSLKEDIQVRDETPTLIIDVKGINGCPQDADATQSEKHALMRSQEENGKFKPLTIINHQRNLPPLDRDQNPYRKEIIKNAEITKLGLMTTWDLFRLMRNKDKLSWPESAVKAVFYRTGKIEPIPGHYLEIGAIAKVWKVRQSFGVVLNEGIRTGDRIAIFDGVQWFSELETKSLQVNSKDVEQAEKGDECGIVCHQPVDSLREGLRVFKVSPS